MLKQLTYFIINREYKVYIYDYSKQLNLSMI